MSQPPSSPNHNPTLSPELQEWHNRGQLRSINGHSIFTIDEGNPALPVVVLIHGFPTSSWDFKKIWPALIEHYRLISLDMLGFGFSDKPDHRNYTIHKQADLFIELLRQLDITEFHLLVHDYGVSVAQELLAKQLEKQGDEPCLSCCFLNGGLFPETHRAILMQKLLLSRFGKYVNALSNFSSFKKSFSLVFGEHSKPSDVELEQAWEAINYNGGRHVFHNLITYMRDRKTHRQRWLTALQIAEVPLAVINGSVDPVSGDHLVDRYQELGCRLDFVERLPTIGHYPHTEAPHAVASAYLKFLNTCTIAN